MRTTALEMLSEPLTLLLLLASAAIAILAPVLHYHQFGEATRMARDAGLSAIFTCGSVLAVFGTIRVMRREVESGTLEMALTHPITRGGFFIAKTAGALLAEFVFILTQFGVLSTMVAGAEAGGRIAEKTGMLARVWGPAVASGVAVFLLSLVVGALLNRLKGCRFVFTTIRAACMLSLGSMTAFGFLVGWGDVVRIAVVAGLLVVFEAVLLTAAAALAIRFAANTAASLAGVTVLLLLPVVGNYYRAESLANGGTLTAVYVGLAVLAALPALAAFMILGVGWTNEKR